MTIGRVALVAHSGKPTALELERDLRALLGERGISVVDDAPDLVVSLGGDGTMLKAAQVAHAADAPLLGVNLGTLGYLTEVDAGGERTALQSVLDGDLEIEERMMLACETSGATERSYVGLNEVLVERSSRHRLVRLTVRIGGERLAAFNADGVIVATPTGSTAYALSAGGPIVSPRAECMVLVPVSAHMIFSRPFVLAPDETVEIAVDGPDQTASLALDGAISLDLGPGAVVEVKRHPRPLKLVRLSGPGFVERLRTKLGLPR
ncbi:MAG TPA: NAD(+)/NADH kinase [Actinomycetota bacterium]|jgi:NAD+ kinase